MWRAQPDNLAQRTSMDIPINERVIHRTVKFLHSLGMEVWSKIGQTACRRQD
jgi:hypothetical protein